MPSNSSVTFAPSGMPNGMPSVTPGASFTPSGTPGASFTPNGMPTKKPFPTLPPTASARANVRSRLTRTFSNKVQAGQDVEADVLDNDGKRVGRVAAIPNTINAGTRIRVDPGTKTTGAVLVAPVMNVDVVDDNGNVVQKNFGEEVQICLSGENTGKPACLAYVDPATDKWVCSSPATYTNGMWCGTTRHFTEFGVAETSTTNQMAPVEQPLLSSMTWKMWVGIFSGLAGLAIILIIIIIVMGRRRRDD